jgi:hypothetical protein
MPAAPELHLAKADFPPEPFGYQHGLGTYNLAWDIAVSLGLFGDELSLTGAAALLHDLGRQAPWWLEDSGCPVRSAAAAEVVLMDNPQWAERPHMVLRACKIIAAHRTTGKPPEDPIGKALWDADLLEASRLDPGGSRGAAVIRESYARLLTPWAREPARQKRRIETHLRADKPGQPWAPGVPEELLRGR